DVPKGRGTHSVDSGIETTRSQPSSVTRGSLWARRVAVVSSLERRRALTADAARIDRRARRHRLWRRRHAVAVPPLLARLRDLLVLRLVRGFAPLRDRGSTTARDAFAGRQHAVLVLLAGAIGFAHRRLELSVRLGEEGLALGSRPNLALVTHDASVAFA